MSLPFRRWLPTLPPLLRLFCAAAILLTLVGIVTRFLCANVFHLTSYPYGSYVTDVDGLDLMTFYPRFKHLHSPEFFSPESGPAYAYPAGVAPLYWLLFRVRYAQIPFVLLGAGITIVFAWFFARALEERGVSRHDARWFVLITGLCSYPFYFEFARGNVEIFMWMITAGAVYAILKDRVWLGASLLGIAIAMKIYPFVFVGLLFSRRKYAPIVFSILVAAAYSILSLWIVCPDISIASQGINHGLDSYRVLYVVPYRPLFSGVDHSLYALIKRILGARPFDEYVVILKGYMLTTALTGLVLYFARIRRMPMINQVLCLTIASILLPPVSFDYTLIHLYVPFVMVAVMLVNQNRRGQTQTRGVSTMIVCFIVLLSQIGEIILHGDRLGGQIKAVVLLTLFILGVVVPFADEFEDVVLPRKSPAHVTLAS